MDFINSSISFLAKGGPVMVPLLIASVLAIGAAIERFAILRGALTGAEELINKVTQMAERRNLNEARASALRHESPVGRVLAAGFDNWHKHTEGCEKAMEEQAMIERESLAKRLVILDTVITIAPLLGLLGTVTGMIKAFQVVGDVNQIGAPSAITGGVAEALIATAAGLAIAIVALVLFNYLNERVRQVVGMMEIAGTRVVNLHTVWREQEGPQDAHQAVSA